MPDHYPSLPYFCIFSAVLPGYPIVCSWCTFMAIYIMDRSLTETSTFLCFSNETARWGGWAPCSLAFTLLNIIVIVITMCRYRFLTDNSGGRNIKGIGLLKDLCYWERLLLNFVNSLTCPYSILKIVPFLKFHAGILNMGSHWQYYSDGWTTDPQGWTHQWHLQEQIKPLGLGVVEAPKRRPWKWGRTMKMCPGRVNHIPTSIMLKHRSAYLSRVSTCFQPFLPLFKGTGVVF